MPAAARKTTAAKPQPKEVVDDAAAPAAPDEEVVAIDAVPAGEDDGQVVGDAGNDAAGADAADAGEGAGADESVSVTPPQFAPNQEASGAIMDTTTSDLLPRGSAQERRLNEQAPDSDYQVLRLAEYLRENFPQQMRVNRQFPEHPVDIAIRLLAGLASQAPAVAAHCDAPYCNLPKGHVEDHGWINYGN